MSIDELKTQFNEKLNGIQSTWENALKQFENSREDIVEELDKLKREKNELQEKYEAAQAKVDRIEGQLANTIEQMETMSKTTDKGIDAMQLLDVYLILMENVFESQSHTRLLIILHGEKEKYTISELKQAAGISGLQVKQAVFDLRNAGIVEYNEETEEVTLKMRFME